MTDSTLCLAEHVRSACLQAALDAYEDAGLRGLCAEGRWECAVEAVRSLPLDSVIQNAEEQSVGDGRDERHDGE